MRHRLIITNNLIYIPLLQQNLLPHELTPRLYPHTKNNLSHTSQQGWLSLRPKLLKKNCRRLQTNSKKATPTELKYLRSKEQILA